MSHHYFEKKISIILRHLKKKSAIVEVSFVTDAAIRKINKQFRKIDKPTDVLSFPMFSPIEKNHFGDVIISLDTAKKQARTGKVLLRDEVLFLMVHALLHLDGHDHIEEEDFVVMRKQEKKIWSLVSDIPFEKMLYAR